MVRVAGKAQGTGMGGIGIETMAIESTLAPEGELQGPACQACKMRNLQPKPLLSVNSLDMVEYQVARLHPA